MRVFIELPTWLGDGVMASAAVEQLRRFCQNFDREAAAKGAQENVKTEFVFFGSAVCVQLFSQDECGVKFVKDESKKARFRLLWLLKKGLEIRKEFGEFDLAVSFRGAFASRFLQRFLKAKAKAVFDKTALPSPTHQVVRYTKFLTSVLRKNFDQNYNETPYKPTLKFVKFEFDKPTLTIAPAAAFGSAKCWLAERFAQFGAAFKTEFDIVILGAKGEERICDEIFSNLEKNSVKAKNLCGKTSVKELCETVAGASLVVCNDSGIMHIAAAYERPCVAIFGPTKADETSPFANPNARILKADLACMPCMKRVCPLATHECMKAVLATQAVAAAREILSKEAENG